MSAPADVPPGFSVLHGKSDFEWHMRALDVAKRHQHEHYGEPERYPARVRSRWAYNSNGADQYWHMFSYETADKCEHCGQPTKGWTEWPEDEGA